MKNPEIKIFLLGISIVLGLTINYIKNPINDSLAIKYIDPKSLLVLQSSPIKELLNNINPHISSFSKSECLHEDFLSNPISYIIKCDNSIQKLKEWGINVNEGIAFSLNDFDSKSDSNDSYIESSINKYSSESSTNDFNLESFLIVVPATNSKKLADSINFYIDKRNQKLSNSLNSYVSIHSKKLADSLSQYSNNKKLVDSLNSYINNHSLKFADSLNQYINQHTGSQRLTDSLNSYINKHSQKLADSLNSYIAKHSQKLSDSLKPYIYKHTDSQKLVDSLNSYINEHEISYLNGLIYESIEEKKKFHYRKRNKFLIISNEKSVLDNAIDKKHLYSEFYQNNDVIRQSVLDLKESKSWVYTKISSIKFLKSFLSDLELLPINDNINVGLKVSSNLMSVFVEFKIKDNDLRFFQYLNKNTFNQKLKPVHYNSGLSFMFRDENIPYYIDLLRRLAPSLYEEYSDIQSTGILDEIADFYDMKSFSIIITETVNGNPMPIVKILISEEEADKLILNLQKQAHKENHKGGEREIHKSIFDRLKHSKGNRNYKYISNDCKKYDINPKEDEKLQPCCSVYQDGVLLIALDLSTLENFLDNTSNNFEKFTTDYFQLKKLAKESPSKIECYLDPEWILTEGLLIDKDTRTNWLKDIGIEEDWLKDFRHFNSILISLNPKDSKIRLSADFYID